MRPTAHELRVMAAALETPDDLTPRELGQAQADIIQYLLAQAELEDLVEETADGNCSVCGRPFRTRKACTC
jgi:hypothetical protein